MEERRGRGGVRGWRKGGSVREWREGEGEV